MLEGNAEAVALNFPIQFKIFYVSGPFHLLYSYVNIKLTLRLQVAEWSVVIIHGMTEDYFFKSCFTTRLGTDLFREALPIFHVLY